MAMHSWSSIYTLFFQAAFWLTSCLCRLTLAAQCPVAQVSYVHGHERAKYICICSLRGHATQNDGFEVRRWYQVQASLQGCGVLQGLYVHTAKNVLIEVHAQVRLPRTFRRFCGLMVQLLQKLSIRATNGPDKLLKVRAALQPKDFLPLWSTNAAAPS